MSEPIQDLDLRRATESDVDSMAEAHRDSILQLGSRYYVPAIVNEWAGVVNPGLYLEAMSRGEVFFIATGTVAGHPMVLGFSSDYVISGTTHGTSAYVRAVAARRHVGSRLLVLAESITSASISKTSTRSVRGSKPRASCSTRSIAISRILSSATAS
jgi:hypothetical protein